MGKKMFVWYMKFCTAFTNEQLLNANVNMSFFVILLSNG